MTELIKRNSFQFLGDYIINCFSSMMKKDIVHVRLAETVDKGRDNEENFLSSLQEPPGGFVEHFVFSDFDAVIIHNNHDLLIENSRI